MDSTENCYILAFSGRLTNYLEMVEDRTLSLSQLRIPIYDSKYISGRANSNFAKFLLPHSDPSQLLANNDELAPLLDQGQTAQEMLLQRARTASSKWLMLPEKAFARFWPARCTY